MRDKDQSETLRRLQDAIDNSRLSDSWREIVTDDDFRRTALIYRLHCALERLTLEQLEKAEDYLKALV